MKSINVKTLDLNLLRLLVVMGEVRSVSQASARLGLSQPATSNALARLGNFGKVANITVTYACAYHKRLSQFISFSMIWNTDSDIQSSGRGFLLSK